MTCTIAATGEELNIKSTDETAEPYITMKRNLRKIIWEAIDKGCDEFYVNCEYGVPLWSAEIICALKPHTPVKLHIIAPFREHCKSLRSDLRERYCNIRRQADSISFASSELNPSSYETADIMMADESTLVILVGTHTDDLFICKYAASIKRPVILRTI